MKEYTGEFLEILSQNCATANYALKKLHVRKSVELAMHRKSSNSFCIFWAKTWQFQIQLI